MRDGGKVGIPEAGVIAQELDAVQQQFTATDYLNLIASNEDGSRLEATVLLNSDPRIERRLIVWEDADYMAVRGTWTDADLAAQITTLLSAS